MKVAHVAVVTPGRCGLYETTRELVKALRDLGVDSRLVDPTHAANKLHPIAVDKMLNDYQGFNDRGAPFATMDWGLKADILVNHSGFDTTPLAKSTQPVVHVAHGRPQSSFNSESSGSTPIYSYHYRENANARFKAVVTFWPEHVPYLQVMWPDTPVHHIQSPVDLDAWTPDGPKGYKFGGKRGGTNVVCPDGFRNDIDPFVALNAYALWARGTQGAKLHIYGLRNKKGWGALIKRIQDDGNMGEVKSWVSGLAHAYRAADCLITSHSIDTRSVREAMACGCPVARVAGPTLNGFREGFSDALSADRKAVRSAAEQQFDPVQTAEQFKQILEQI